MGLFSNGTATISSTTFCDHAGGDHIGGSWTDGGGNIFSDICFPDCNNNGIDDALDLAKGTSSDCNGNSVPDECDIVGGYSTDMNPNDGIPDEGQGLPSGACCFGSLCVTTAATPCGISGGVYYGDDFGCDSLPCGEVGTGACCISGTCIAATLPDCFAAAGVFAGEFITCAEVNCPTECVGDLNGDGEVKVQDLLMLIAAWGTCP